MGVLKVSGRPLALSSPPPLREHDSNSVFANKSARKMRAGFSNAGKVMSPSLFQVSGVNQLGNVQAK
jgi:hypothetical protein